MQRKIVGPQENKITSHSAGRQKKNSSKKNRISKENSFLNQNLFLFPVGYILTHKSIKLISWLRRSFHLSTD